MRKLIFILTSIALSYASNDKLNYVLGFGYGGNFNYHYAKHSVSSIMYLGSSYNVSEVNKSEGGIALKVGIIYKQQNNRYFYLRFLNNQVVNECIVMCDNVVEPSIKDIGLLYGYTNNIRKIKYSLASGISLINYKQTDIYYSRGLFGSINKADKITNTYTYGVPLEFEVYSDFERYKTRYHLGIGIAANINNVKTYFAFPLISFSIRY